MSSALLYLAIVGVWIAVLVPMWLRREHTGHFFTRRRPDDHTYDEEIPEPNNLVRDAESETLLNDGRPVDSPRTARPPGEVRRPIPPRRRAKIIARRRRRTTLLATLLVATTALAASGAMPWWIVTVPVLLLAGHVALLREAAADDARQARAAAARRHALQTRVAQQTAIDPTPIPPDAKIIDFTAHAKEEIYDQYADAEKRAVND